MKKKEKELTFAHISFVLDSLWQEFYFLMVGSQQQKDRKRKKSDHIKK